MKASLLIILVLFSTILISPQTHNKDIAVMLIQDSNTSGTDTIAALLTELTRPFTRYTSTAALALPTSEWLTFGAVLYIGVASTTQEKDSITAYLNAGGNLLCMDNDEGYSAGTSDFFLNYLMAKYISDAGSDTIIRGVEIMLGLELDITSDPYPDGVMPNAGTHGTGIPIFKGKSDTLCAGIRGDGGTFRTTLLCWDPQYGSDHNTKLLIINRVLNWVADGFVPVELASFDAFVDRNKVNLNWTTATETNNLGFDVERSKGGEFIKVGFVQGFGTTTQEHQYTYKDNVAPGHYTYRLKQIDLNGSYDYSGIVEVDVKQPDVYSLNQNYPNPFNPNTIINYSLANTGQVSINVYDVLGNEIQTLLNEVKPAGAYQLQWNAENLPSGVYFYQMNAGDFNEIKKMILIK